MKLKLFLFILLPIILFASSEVNEYRLTVSSQIIFLFFFVNIIFLTIFYYVIKSRFEEKYESQNNELVAILQSIPDLLWIKNKDGIYLECNKRFEDFFGAKREKIVGKSDYDFVDKNLADFFREHDKKAMNSDTPLSNFEEIKFAVDGHIEYLQTIKTKIIDRNGNVIGILGIGRDFTDQRDVTKKLMEQKEEFETIFNYSRDGIVVLDRKYKILNSNNEFANIIGIGKQKINNINYLDLVVEEQKKQVREDLEKSITLGHIENIENNLKGFDNRAISVLYSSSLLPDNERIILFIKDLTKIKIAEQQTRLASMGEMIGNIAHQWRQPLSVITTNASGMSLKAEMEMPISNKEIIDVSSQIIKQAKYLSETIDSFRNFIKGEKTIANISIKEIIENSISLVEASLHNHFVKLILNFEDDLQIHGNKNELSEAFINIINNAKDALKEKVKAEDERLIFIETKSYDKDQLRVTIYDSAGGIEPSIRDRIFEPYFTTKYKSQGTGLGLAMVHKIIEERYEGKINVYNKNFKYEDREYFGACFEITFTRAND